MKNNLFIAALFLMAGLFAACSDDKTEDTSYVNPFVEVGINHPAEMNWDIDMCPIALYDVSD